MDSGPAGVTAKYGLSPLAVHDKAISTATALLLLDVSRESINFELRRQHGFTEGHAAAVIREAATLVPRSSTSRSMPRRIR